MRSSSAGSNGPEKDGLIDRLKTDSSEEERSSIVK